MLPRLPDAESGLAEVAARVREHGGTATLSVIAPAEPGWEDRLVAAVNRARDEEYEEVADTAERLVEEIARETRKGKLTFAVLEEVEGEHERLERWLERVRARDACGAPLRAQAEAKLATVRAEIERFADEVHRRDDAPHQADASHDRGGGIGR